MIKFGTDGWRAIISQDFTIENLTKVISAIAQLIKSEERRKLEIYNIDYSKYTQASYKVQYRDYTKGVAIGYDYRFMSEYFAQKTAEIISSYNIPVFLSQNPCSTPALSMKVAKNFAAGIMITASHNPYIYNGVKYKAEYGGSATDQMTKIIEKHLDQIDTNLKPNYSIINRSLDFQQEYLENISNNIDLEKIKKFIQKNNIIVIVDYMFGVLSGSFKKILNLESIIEINNYRNPYFNGLSPEPIPQNLQELKKIVKLIGPNSIGFAFDGDGDRIFAINNQDWITPHEILPLLAIHLIKNRKWEGKVVRTISTSTKIDRLAEKFNIESIQTPVGFKYIADLFIRENILIGGEESGGIGFKNHIPERDSLLNALLILEMLADLNIHPSEVLNYLHSMTEQSSCHRKDLHFQSIDEQKYKYHKISQDPNSLKQIFEQASIQIEIKDYIKLEKDKKNWVLIRPSGTEPVIRIYSEADTYEKAVDNTQKVSNILQQI
ncbi:MAG: hypothetical protein ABDH21_06825 [bacterium]